MGNQQVKLKSGATEHGRIYENQIAALFSIKCAMDPNVADFWIVSNIDGFGAFDDIIICIEYIDNSIKLFCIQLKHKDNKPLQVTQLVNPKSKFYLKKYEESFEEIKQNVNNIDILEGIPLNQMYFVLYTNATIPMHKTDSLILRNIDNIELLNTSSKDNSVFQISNSPKSKISFDESFLQQFYLFESQSVATKLDKLIKNEFYSHFQDVGNTVLITIIDYFAKWSIGRGGKITKICKKDVQRMLLEFLLLPHCMEPNEVVQNEDEILNMLNDTLTNFNVTPIRQENLLKDIFGSIKSTLGKLCGDNLSFQLSWNTHLTIEQTDRLMDDSNQRVKKFLAEKQRYVPYLTLKDFYLSAWQCKIVPLIINCNIYQNSITEILVKFKDVTKDLSFVLLNPSNTSELMECLNVFGNINDIKDSNLLKRNLENTHISLQGKKSMQLIDLIGKTDILEQVTPDVYMILLDGVLQIGETHEVENYYINRHLQPPFLQLEVLNKSNILKDRKSLQNQHGDIFLFIEPAEIFLRQYRNNTMDLEMYFMSIENKEVNDDIYILTTNMEPNDKILFNLVKYLYDHTKKAVHVVRLWRPFLEWIFSKGIIESLHDFLVESTLFLEEGNHSYIPEDDMLQHFHSKTNIISNNAGMGKSFMLKSIANKYDATKWVCYLNLSEHISAITGMSELSDFVKYLFDYQMKYNDKIVYDFCKKIFVHSFEIDNMVWLLDGYDEVSSENILLFLQEIKQRDIRSWITTRPTYRRELEIKLDTLSLEITHFSKNDYTSFLWKYFDTFKHIYNYNEEQIQYIINTINKCSSNLDKTFIAIPLQTRMFAEIFGDDINQISDKEKLTLIDLYNKFVNIKLKEYKSYEATSLKKTLSKLALKIFYTDEQLDDLLDFEELAEEALTFQESYRKDSIVIGLNEKGDAVFGHRTFAEFLAAYWLAKQIINRRGEYNLNWAPLIEKLYYIEMLPVRAFFDRMLSENIPLHLAVLNNDLENVELFLKNEQHKNDLDKLGRSALHLAVSYGKYYDLYLASEVKGLKGVGLHSAIKKDGDSNCDLNIPRMEKNQYQITEQIVEKLLNHGLSNSTDKLFNYDAFDYAMKSCSLNFVNCLYSKFEKANLLFEDGYNLNIFMYAIAYDNLYRILSERKTYDFDVSQFPLKRETKLRNMFHGLNSKLLTTKYNGSYLTEIAALRGGKEIIYELLQSGTEMGYAVHRACFNGHVDVVDLLNKMGADIEEPDKTLGSPLEQSARRGRGDIAYLLLSSDQFLSKAKEEKYTSMTPLHYACQGGHRECVEKLIESGVNINKKDSYGYTPLVYVNMYGYANVIKPMLNNISKEDLIANKEIQSALNVAASNGYDECVKILLGCGLNVNNIDKDGNTPLILASQKGFPKVIKELANYNCDLHLMKANETLESTTMYSSQIGHNVLCTKLVPLGIGNRKSPCNITALHFAVRNGNLDCVETLIDLGVDITIKDTISGFNCVPLVWASMYGRSTILEKLLKQIPSTESVARDVNNVELALIWSAILGYDTCVNMLIEYLINCISRQYCEDEEEKNQHQKRVKQIVQAEFGLDALTMDIDGYIILLLAAKNGHPAVVLQLLLNIPPNLRRDGLKQALHWAAKSGHVKTVEVLIQMGADENLKNDKGLQLIPIVWASMYGRTNVVEFLLSNKPETYLENKDLHLALNWAALGGHYDCVKLLLKFGLDVNNIDKELNDNTPLISACEYRGTLKVVDELLAGNCIVDMKNSDGKTALDFAIQTKKFDIVKRLINTESYKNMQFGDNSLFYQNLQLALNWAVDNKEQELIDKLVRLGITDKTIKNST